MLIRCRLHWHQGVGILRINDIAYPVYEPTSPPHVPTSPLTLSQPVLQSIRWMLQKDMLQQDIFLLGHPGPARRWLALKFCEVAKREVEYLTLSRDTTEVDIKQRREIRGNTVFYVHQPAVTAALLGRVLILEGIEKAERNVLPVINNLLENREMRLEDGSFLMSSRRYDELLEDHSEEEMTKMGLLRVSPRFRVIALGLPVPRYKGTPLDPPLRSRFQCRAIHTPTPEEVLTDLTAPTASSVAKELKTMVTVMEAITYYTRMRTDQDRSSIVPSVLSLQDVRNWYRYHATFPADPLGASLHLFYPWAQDASLSSEVLNRFECSPTKSTYSVESIGPAKDNQTAELVFKSTPRLMPQRVSVQAPCGASLSGSQKGEVSQYIPTDSNSQVLCQMLQSHALGNHICLIGGAGSGKTALVRHFANVLHYGEHDGVETQHMFTDMSTRDLLQRRTTLKNGDTAWELTPLMRAVRDGRIAVLDGIDALPHGALFTLQQLLIDGRITLLDGTLVIPAKEYDALSESQKQSTNPPVMRVHPSFRVVATARPSSGKKAWLNEDVASLFSFITLPDVTTNDVNVIISSLYPNVSRSISQPILALSQLLIEKRKEDNSVPTLSLRHILRLHRKATLASSANPETVSNALEKLFLLDLMPKIGAKTIRDLMTKSGLQDRKKKSKEFNIETRKTASGDLEVLLNGVLMLTVPTSTYTPAHRSLIPSIVYFDNAQHTATIAAMIEDYVLGFHMLLIGNQGVGKNKIVDKFLQTLQIPRQYIQLHRDTTVTALTLSPNVIDGRLVWEDSPMIKAVTEGHVLVVDEIDKAPVEVVQVLKGLLEDREMTLGDGRRIGVDIKIHPNFRVIALANRPGYPFLGNDFFKSCGDMLSCHPITNPDTESQLVLLSKYGPNVPRHALTVLNGAFNDIAKLVDQGVLTYPYSLRELANVVRHINDYPQDGLATALLNVFHFDDFDENTKEMILKVFQNAGIPLTGQETSFARRLANQLAQEKKLNRSSPIGSFAFVEDKSESHMVSVTSEILTPGTQSTLVAATKPVDLSMQLPEQDSLTFTEALGFIECNQRGDKIQHITPITGGLLALFFNSGLAAFCQFDSQYSQMSFEYRTYGIANSCSVVSSAPLANESIAIVTSDGTLTIVDTDSLSGKTFPSILPGVAPTSIRVEPIQGKTCLLLWSSESGDVGLLSPTHNELLRLKLPKSLSSPLFDVSFVETQSGPGIVYTDGSASNKVFHVLMTPGEQMLRRWFAEVPGFQKVNLISPALNNCALVGASKSTPVTLMDTNRIPLDFEKENSVSVLMNPDVDVSTTVPYKPYNDNTLFARVIQNSVELVSLPSETYRMMKVKSPITNTTNNSITHLPDDVLLVVTHEGTRCMLFDINPTRLQSKYGSWKALYSEVPPTELQMSYNTTDKDPSMNVRHGKEDPDNKPHVGGNQWAGGTGGTDTAGLGGRVGPYRLDKGHQIHQVPQWQKDSVPEHIKAEARRVGKEALKKRLDEIHMTEKEDQMYQQAFENVKYEIQILKSMMQALRSKQGERVWSKNQVEGVLDDSKIVDGITGDKAIFKRRSESTDPGFNKFKKKRMMFVVDCSASMYRFNSMDGRLDREVETVIMLMEALNDSHDTVSYSIVGHSGDEPAIVFVDFDKPPKNRKDRLQICLRIIAHSQYCWTGDHTVEAMEHAAKTITNVDSDSYSIFVISDANLQQYGISPKKLAKIVKSDERVEMYCIFIASIGQQAKQIQEGLPSGHGFVAFSAKEIPQILRRIFVAHDHLMGSV